MVNCTMSVPERQDALDALYEEAARFFGKPDQRPNSKNESVSLAYEFIEDRLKIGVSSVHIERTRVEKMLFVCLGEKQYQMIILSNPTPLRFIYRYGMEPGFDFHPNIFCSKWATDELIASYVPILARTTGIYGVRIWRDSKIETVWVETQ